MFSDKRRLWNKVLVEFLTFSIITSNAFIPVAVAAPPAESSGQSQRLIIKLRQNLTDTDAASIVAQVRGSIHRSLRALRTHVAAVPKNRSAAILELLKQDPRVESAEIDQTRQIADIPNDAAYATQWALPKIGWDQIYGVAPLNGTSTLAVLDTGVQSNDLNMVAGWSAFGTDPTIDPNGHGTSVASIAAATTNNGLGIAGVAFSNVSVMPIQVLASDGTGQDSDVIAGITWAVDNGANVILMAFSAQGYSAALQDAIDYAWAHGVVVVAAAGNDGSTTPAYPAGDTNTMGVGATDQNDAMWSGSNISPAVFITAPGVEISTNTANGDVASVTGTSASAAIVAGAAALLKASDNTATPGMIVGRLAITADPVGMANGRLNIAKAIASTSTTEVAPAGAPYGGPYVGPYVAAANRKVKVTLAGIAQATVTSTPTGISCNASNSPCTQNFNSTQAVTLTVSLLPGATFTGWSGACSGTSLTCSLPASSSDQNVTATIGGKYQSTTAVTCPSSVVYNGSLQTPCTASWSSPQPGSGSLVPTYSNNQLVGTATANASFAGDANNTSSSDSSSFQITKAPLTVTFTVANKAYDGTTAASITGCSLSGVASVDAGHVTCRYSSATANFNNASVGNNTVSATGFTLTGSAAGNYSVGTINSASGTISALPLDVSFTAANKTYDGGTIATITGCSLSGVIGTDNVTCSYSGATANFSDKNVGTSKNVSGSGFSLTGTAASNYSVGSVATAHANITALALSLSFVSPNKVYDGTTAASVTSCLVSGALSGDTVSCSISGATATFADKNVGTAKTVTGANFSLTGANATNYSVSPPYTTTANITARPLNITATGVNKAYDGTTTATVTLNDNRVSGDILSESYSAASFATAAVGTNKAVTVSGISISGTDAGNYTFNTSASTSANITAKSVSLSFTVADKIYDGTSTAVLSGCTLSGVVAGDVVSCNTSTSPTFSDKNAGTAKLVTGINFALSGANASNYALASATATTTGNILQRALIVSANGINKSYDGTTAASVTLSDNRIAGDVFLDGYASAAFATANVGTGKVVGVSGIFISGLDAANYSYNTTASTTANITAQSVSIVFTVSDKIYDGTNAAAIASCSVTGVLAGDNVACALTGATATFLDKNVGAGKIVTGTGFTLSGANAANYSLNSSAVTAVASITKRTLTISAAGVNKAYDGTASASVTLSDDRLAGDNLTASYAAAEFADAKGGTAKAVSVSGISVSGSDAGNYSWNTSAITSANITPIQLTVTADNQSRLYGSANPTLTASIDGFIPGEMLLTSDVLGVPTCTTLANAPSTVGNYAITCAQGTLTSTNYSFVFQTGTLHINPAPLIITPDADPTTLTTDKFSRVYGAANPATYALRYDGFVNNETSSVLAGAAAFATTATATSPVGEYAINASGLSSANYAITFAPGALDVTQANLLVNADPQTKTYGAADPTLAWHLTGFVAGDTSASESGAPSCSRAPGEAAGTYTITCNPGSLSSANYKFSQGATAAMTITQGVLSVNAEDASKVYGSNDPTFIYHFSGFALGDTELTAAISGIANCHRAAGEGVGASPYVITCDAGSLASPNYTFATGSSANLSITPAVLTVAANAQSRLYGAANPSPLPATISGFAFSETLQTSDVQGSAACETSAIATSPVVPAGYPITCSVGSLSSTNYTFAFVGGILHINPAPLTIAPDADPTTEATDKFSRVYGAANPATYALRYDGFVNNETPDVLAGTAVFAATATATSPVGEYPVTVSGLTSANYAITFAPGALNVTQASLLVNADPQSKTYGASDPTLSWHLTGFVAGDASAGESGAPSCSRAPGEAAGTYAITCNPGTLASANYKFSTGATAPLTINKATLSVNADPQAKTYGAIDPALTWHLAGFVAGDTSAGESGAPSCSRTSGESAGTYTITCNLGTLASANYSFVLGTSSVFTINKAVLSVDAVAVSKTYGSVDPSLTWTYSGMVGNDNLALVMLGTSGDATCSRTSGENVGSYTITCTPGSLSNVNYNFVSGSSANLTIGKATLAVNEANDLSKVYGSTDPTFTYNLSGFMQADNAANSGITGSGVCSRAPGENVGTYAISCVPGTLNAPNYNFVQGTTGTFTITKATLRVNAVAAFKIAGASDPTFSYALSGFLLANNASNSSITGSPSCKRTAGETAGSYTITCSAGTLNAPNYGFVPGATASFAIRYAFTGFIAPVDMTAINVANAGKAIPLKFIVKDALGNGVASLPGFKIYQYIYQCGDISTLLSNDLTAYATGASGLQNLGGGNYQYNWNTDKSYKGSCRQIQVSVGDDLVHVAEFQFN